MTSIRMDESLRVLLFVCLPLLALLAGLVILLIVGSRRTATFATFSVAMSSVRWARASVTYRDGERQLKFEGQVGRGRNFFIPRISLEVSDDIPDGVIRQIAPNLAAGLTKLHYEYFIYRRADPQPIAKEEQQAAIAQLRKMGFEVEDSQNGAPKAVTHNWERMSGNKAKARILQVQALLSKARGIKESIEVLAASR